MIPTRSLTPAPGAGREAPLYRFRLEHLRLIGRRLYASAEYVKVLFNSTGNKNIAIGFKAGVALTSGNSDIYLGHPGASSESQTMRLGSTQTSTFIATPSGDKVKLTLVAELLEAAAE